MRHRPRPISTTRLCSGGRGRPSTRRSCPDVQQICSPSPRLASRPTSRHDTAGVKGIPIIGQDIRQTNLASKKTIEFNQQRSRWGVLLPSIRCIIPSYHPYCSWTVRLGLCWLSIKSYGKGKKKCWNAQIYLVVLVALLVARVVKWTSSEKGPFKCA